MNPEIDTEISSRIESTDQVGGDTRESVETEAEREYNSGTLLEGHPSNSFI